MPRISLKTDSELPAHVLSTVKAMEEKGADASVSRGLAHCQEMFDSYFKFYLPARQGRSIEDTLIELVRLKIARHNDCFT